MHNLTVYRASAGSGKTFTLAVQYIRLLIENPHAYRNTLAVTFTNKATEEMKMRILTQLYGISRDLKESKPYLDNIRLLTSLDKNVIINNAKYALSELVHNYSYFRVETIDAFFQTVLRNLARELELTANLRIELNDTQVEQQAVDQLIEDLNDSSLLLSWILEYIHENMDDDKSWNVIAQIKHFGMNIFKEYYKRNRQKIKEVFEEKDFFKHYTSRLRTIRAEADKQIRKCGTDFFTMIEQNGFSISDFSNGSRGVCGYFLKLQSGDFIDDEKVYNKTAEVASSDPAKWVIKKRAYAGDPIYDLVCSQLMPMLVKAEKKRKQQTRLYKSAELTLRHLNQLRLLDSIGDKVEELNRELNRFMLSDTQTLLRSMIAEDDSPFIFEKIGTQLKNIMVDEFQDTSTIQWENFRVLLRETMSHDNSNLIVGDVKQSIYRWRSGDWRLLNDIEHEFNTQEIHIIPLKTNRRSEKRIITFNNVFFEKASLQEYLRLKELTEENAEQLKKAYQDVTQDIPQGKDDVGTVEIKLLTNNKEYNQETLRLMTDKVQELIDAGVKERDIAILVRTNSIIQEVGDYFLQYKPNIHLVSEEAFHLDASQAVNMIICGMMILDNPNDTITIATLIKLYVKSNADVQVTDSDILLKGKAMEDALPKDFLNKRTYLLSLSLIDMAEALYKIFNLQSLSGQTAYICTFYDKLNEFMQDSIPDLHSFLEQWADSLHSCSIQSSNNEGINLVTIHKSKGLEFDHVIIPFCDWQLEKNNIIWCKPQETPFNALPIVPIDFSKKKMTNSIYEQDYVYEHFQNVVDNLNLLYVAFTRAGKGLYIYGKKGDNGSGRSWIIENCLQDIATTLQAQFFAPNNNEEPICFSYGSGVSASPKKQNNDSENIFNRSATDIDIIIENYESKLQFRQSNKSKDFIRIGEETEDELKEKSYIQLGNIMHKIFSTIKTTDDMDIALKELEEEGVLYNKVITQEKLRKTITDRLNDPRVSTWFSKHWTLFNECSILKLNPLTDKVEVRRPDRVMTDGNEMIVVDYKFGKPQAEHKIQVAEYMALLKDMGYNNISGYIWYLFSNKIIKL
ncbi:UvrD-helicase domain-containing protein [Segatella maculosa]|uniref:UvrD-helicase domain-containing protein n=1 Tax=Segatella maculosa TaxID=439703 RepID=UPI0023F2186C|nr:UvrD-helicase domain-containing protein [Segatella maculosa]